LNFDLTLGAFYPWTISSDDDDNHICGIFTTPRFNNAEEEVAVYSGVDPVIDGSSPVVVTQNIFTLSTSTIKYITVAEDQFSIAAFDNTNFVDWETEDGTGDEYTSFVETGYELLDDAMRNKQAPWIYCYFKRTETGYEPDGDDFTLVNKSSCTFRTKWNWTGASTSNKWSEAREVYRLLRLPPLDENDLELDDDWRVIVTRNKVRGIGRALQFRFECSDRERDFNLLGWSAQYRQNTVPG
jgi:hypothetical protein